MTYLDTRDLWTELTELQDRRADEDKIGPLDEDDAERLAALADLFDEIGESLGRDGEAMIPEDDFEDYAQELADDLGLVPESHSWPASCIDWERAARELQADYSLVSFEGTGYFIRS